MKKALQILNGKISLPLRTLTTVFILLGLLLPALAAGPGVQNVQAAPSGQSGGYWVYVETESYPNEYIYDDPARDTHEISLTDSGGSFYHLAVSADGTSSYTHQFTCNWEITAPQDLSVLMPGDTLEAVASCSDSSQVSAEGTGTGGSNVKFAFNPPGINAYVSEQIAFQMGFGYQETNSTSGTLTVPSGPFGGDWGNRIAVGFHLAFVGFVQRVYEWVPGDTAVAPSTNNPPSSDQGEPSISGEPPEDNSSGWVVVVGVGGALAVGAAAVVAVVRAGRGKGAKTYQPPQYILQLSTRSLEVKPGEQAGLAIQAWKVKPDNPTPVPAPEAQIRVMLAASPAGLVVTPDYGVGSLNCYFSAPHPAVCDTLTVPITASANGVSTQTSVTVKILPSYQLDLQWCDPQNNRLQPGGKEAYACARLVATPQPDPQSTPDFLAGRIRLDVQGPNQDRIRLQSVAGQAPYVQGGSLWIPITATQPAPGESMQKGNPSLAASYLENGQNLIQRLPLIINGDVVLDAWVQGQKQVSVIYNRKLTPAAWDFSEIVAYFHEPNDDRTPVHPPFSYKLTADSVRFDPPVLEVKEIASQGADQYTIRVRQKPGAELDESLPLDPATSSRCVTVTLSVTDDQQRTLKTEVKYLLKPTVVFCVHSFDQNPAVLEGHEYRKIQLKPLAFVANADDGLNLAGYFARVDQFVNGKPDPNKALDLGNITEISWRDAQDRQELGDQNPANVTTNGKFLTFILKSARPVEALPERIRRDHVLTVRAELSSQFKDQYTLESELAEVKIEPEYPRLHMWVVPGTRRNTSDVLTYVHLLPSRAPLGGQDVFLTTLSPDGMALSLDECESRQASFEQGTTSIYGPGVCLWRLRYAGITWANMTAAGFTVRSGLQKNPDGSWLNSEYCFNVYENMRKVLSAITDDAIGDTTFAKSVNNPAFAQSGTITAITLSDDDGDLIESTRGPVWNISKLFQSAPYVCSDLRDKIGEWMLKYRFYQGGGRQGSDHVRSSLERMKSMNGVEFGFYALTPIHVWAGVFPAGANRFSEYRALDPWWRQKWDDAWRAPERLWTQADEQLRLSAMVHLNLYLASTVISMLPGMALSEAIGVVRAYLRGATPAEINALIKSENKKIADWFDFLQFYVDCVVDQESQVYSGGEGEIMRIWFKDIVNDLDR